jgi:hypothetical protein
MANVRHHDVETRLLELVYHTPPEVLVLPLRDLARDILAEGHPREELLANFEHVREEVRRRSRAEAREDAVMDVMDFLYGWSASHMTL